MAVVLRYVRLLLLVLPPIALGSRVTGHEHILGAEGSQAELNHSLADSAELNHSLADSAAKDGQDAKPVKLVSAADFIRELGGTNGCVQEEGETLGCAADAGCPCGRFEQCYPKFQYFPATNSSSSSQVHPRERVNLGTCGLAMIWLVTASVLLFFFLVMGVVSARMYLAKDMPAEPNQGTVPFGTVAYRETQDMFADQKKRTPSSSESEASSSVIQGASSSQRAGTEFEAHGEPEAVSGAAPAEPPEPPPPATPSVTSPDGAKSKRDEPEESF
eukprot:TRINITY_DN3149_c0_g2_i1.p1 TRINITY_DN3149_c0_g2~~TRINITY_DN3149_c0_g2_i1.p1  ORF type:complete len:285 (+),score=46.56 TRINITY_DN3149_c0_g2_i1:36-857(+)